MPPEEIAARRIEAARSRDNEEKSITLDDLVDQFNALIIASDRYRAALEKVRHGAPAFWADLADEALKTE